MEEDFGSFESCYPIKDMRGVITTMVMAQTPEQGLESARALYVAMELCLLCMAAVADTPSALFGDDKSEVEAFRIRVKHYMPIVVRFAKGLHESGGCPQEGGIHGSGDCGVTGGDLHQINNPGSDIDQILKSPIGQKLMEDAGKRLNALNSEEGQKQMKAVEESIAKDIDELSRKKEEPKKDPNVGMGIIMDAILSEYDKQQKKRDGDWKAGPDMN